MKRKTAKEQVEILWEALSYMEEYNSRSKFLCVALSLGFETDDEKHFTIEEIKD